ncbi:hypothetical protein JG687_00010225 [Phytophthora cactorum]|uniref:Uncharacterized protein n=1 Tax=Phytophthora cactorum TaxID=29920 RepID=A0A8T1U7E1_9STRA|nr:hypothetical protein JG687_00010225 [Phytophthora cactorum]
MGNAAAVQSVAESSRRRLLLQQYNRQPRTVLVSNSLMQAFEQRRLQSLQPQLAHSFHRSKQTQQGSSNKESLQSLPLNEIYDVLTDNFGVQLTLEELPTVLRHLGCRVVESPTAASNSDLADEWYSLQGLLGYVAPRRILRGQDGRLGSTRSCLRAAALCYECTKPIHTCTAPAENDAGRGTKGKSAGR